MNSESSEFLTVTRSICPLCNRETRTNWVKDNIPFFGEVIYITTKCDCGFRYSDTLITDQKRPVRYEMKIRTGKDLDARVVRSTSGTIRIPELGVDIEPGPASESFVSNIEGVLDRVNDILDMVTRWNDDEKTKRALELQAKIEKIKTGECKITVIIEDPMGNSAIISENASCRELTEEEVKRLKTGTIVFEKE